MQLYNTLSAEERAQLIDEAGKQRLTLSFYAYAKIEDPKKFRDDLFIEWNKLDALGRTYVAKEGINAPAPARILSCGGIKKIKNYNKKTTTMKKTILVLATVLFSLSCSNDVKEYDVRDDLSYLNFQNEKLRGVWYFSKVIKGDGSIENYNHICTTNKDYVDFQPTRIRDYYYWNINDCSFLYNDFSSDHYLVNGYTLSNCDEVVEGSYSYSNANNTLRVDYASVRTLMNPDNNTNNIKGLIFTRN